MYSTRAFQDKIKETEQWFEKELSSVRTGRANPAILDAVRVDSYGSLVPLNQVGNISVEDARMIRISPWDQSQIKAVEKAIAAANLGLSLAIDDKGVRVIFPELTGERRAAIVKVAKEKFEQARITIRKERDQVIQDIEKKEKAKEMGEDDKFRLKAEVQKLVDEANKRLEAGMAKKEKEILS
jgi:ribosome recycling factor